MDAKLLRAGWLKRLLLVTTNEGVFEVGYNGAGFGYESILVNGEVVAKLSGTTKMTPRFDFKIGSRDAIVEVRIPWWGELIPFCPLKSFSLEVDGDVVYAEGEPIGNPAEAVCWATCPKCGATDAHQVGFTWWGGLVGAALLKHVECQSCRTRYNGKTGRYNETAIAIYCVAGGLFGFAVAMLVGLVVILRSSG